MGHVLALYCVATTVSAEDADGFHCLLGLVPVLILILVFVVHLDCEPGGYEGPAAATEPGAEGHTGGSSVEAEIRRLRGSADHEEAWCVESVDSETVGWLVRGVAECP